STDSASGVVVSSDMVWLLPCGVPGAVRVGWNVGLLAVADVAVGSHEPQQSHAVTAGAPDQVAGHGSPQLVLSSRAVLHPAGVHDATHDVLLFARRGGPDELSAVLGEDVLLGVDAR